MASLRDIPGLSGYLEQSQINQQTGASQLSQLMQTAQVAQVLQKQQQEAELRRALASSGGDISKLMPILLQHGNVAGYAQLQRVQQKQQELDDLKKWTASQGTTPAVVPPVATPMPSTTVAPSVSAADIAGITDPVERAAAFKARMTGAVSTPEEFATKTGAAAPQVDPRAQQAEMYKAGAAKAQAAYDSAPPSVQASPRGTALLAQARFFEGLHERITRPAKQTTAADPLVKTVDTSGKIVYTPRSQAAGMSAPQPTPPLTLATISDPQDPAKAIVINARTGDEIGGKAPPNSGAMGAREAVFTQRVITSANQASKDLANVVQLPLSASTGIFGGRRQGAGLFDAGREVMANKVTSQEAQQYNAMATGFQRSLAAIEAAGLMPSGSLTHQMDAVLFKEGDTNLTKLHKLAQTRQIVESGMEVLNANPRVSPDEKKKVGQILETITKAVPFTHEDLMKLSAAQQINSNATLKDVLGTKGKAALAPQNAKGWTLHTDAKGNKAYVSPDGKQYEEVK
jgi:hypothetical protein